MPEPSATELAKEAEQEAAVFAQAMNVEKLLNMLRALDPAKDNLADDEDIQVGIIIFLCFLYVANTRSFRSFIDLVWLFGPRS